jgi:transcriptional regulator with XRE-family HTH domain
MKQIILENVKIHLKKELKDEKFRELYEKELVKVALARKIAEMREEEKLNQSELATRMNVSQQFVSQIETGEQDNLTLDTLLKIARSLDREVKITFTKKDWRKIEHLANAKGKVFASAGEAKRHIRSL